MKTPFNVTENSLKMIAAVVKAHGNCIIHGDGILFAGPDAEKGSAHHREYNSGVAEINELEPISRAKFFAKYDRNKLPKSIDEVISEFYENEKALMIANSKAPETSDKFNISIEDDEPKKEVVKKATEPEKEVVKKNEVNPQ